MNPRRGSNDKEPWSGLDLTAITGQTIEAQHVFDVHLGETLVPYTTLPPLKAVLPVKNGECEIPLTRKGVGGVRLGGLGRRMRERWRTISRLWEENRAAANKMSLAEQLDYYGKLSSQLKWLQDPGDRPFRVVYNQSGLPTAAMVHSDALMDKKLYWVTCKTLGEVHYLLAIINSRALYEAVAQLMPKGQFGERDLEKHLWKLSHPGVRSAQPTARRSFRCGRGGG